MGDLGKYGEEDNLCGVDESGGEEEVENVVNDYVLEK